MAALPQAVRAVLHDLLPLYQGDRKRWPLWTYDRTKPAEGGIGVEGSDVQAAASSSGDAPSVDPSGIPEALQPHLTWSGADSWATRLQFAPRYIVRRVLSDEGGGNLPVHERPVYYFDRSPGAQARIAAVFSAMACPTIPDSPDVVEIPDNWTRHSQLDSRDRQDLRQSLEFVLHWRWYGESVGVSGVRSGLDHIIEAHHQSARDQTDEGWEDPAEASRLIVQKLLERLGLWPDLKGGSGLPISGARLVQLVEEAEGVVEHVRDWRPTDEFQVKVWDLLPAEDAADRELRRAKMERGRQPPKEVRDLACSLRFPFLTRDEIGTSQDESLTAKLAARDLVAGRLKRAPRTVENLLSRAQPSQ